MSSRLAALAFDAADPQALAQFWGSILDRHMVEERRGTLLPGDATQVGLRFVPSDSEKRGPNRVHLHLTSSSPEDQERLVALALSLGASHLDVGQRPEERHVVLADPQGNEFCVIPPGTSFLAGCGLLGELACDGTRAVGLFWRDALGWPLVWDQDEETAIQSPEGGTKVAWGGPPVAPKHERNRQHLELATTAVESELGRLLSLGATRLDVDDEASVWLADPDGNEFALTADD